ncbi:MAG: MarR family transcriptional regulator [Chloroflexi bacterium]|nr:MarR family transcriptional regulator [Chloroflexota bacterium]
MTAEFERDVAQFWESLFAIVIDAEKRLAVRLTEHDLTQPQFYVLKTLIEHDGRCAIGQIAREHGLTNATMTGLVKRLEAQAPPLVQRERNDADRRSVYVLLTPAGSARYQAVQNDLLEQLRLLLMLFSPEERRELLQLLSRYVETVVGHLPVD